MRREDKVFIANWKMHKSAAEGAQFVKELISLTRDVPAWVGIAPPFTGIAKAAEAARGSRIHIGAQNLNDHDFGAYTGEVSADMIIEAGATFTLIGHSERRQIFHEDDLLLRAKLERALNKALIPVLCVGETLEERESLQTEAVIEKQLSSVLKGMAGCDSLIIAYEPVWAIGTGKVASPEMAQETHFLTRNILATLLGKDLASKMPILYGGSVKPENACDLLKEPDIDGALIGGASLSLTSFNQIIQATL